MGCWLMVSATAQDMKTLSREWICKGLRDRGSYLSHGNFVGQS